MEKFIVYACPVGEFNSQLELYFQISQIECGKNAAHKYMPHCTLTGFFEDELISIPIYIKALNQALLKFPNPEIKILNITFKPEWHGLELYSPILKQLIIDFAKTANSPTRNQDLRLKDWLHLSLAYEFPEKQQENLKKIAQQTINHRAFVRWELRFYQLHFDGSWTCHQSWKLCG
ncbi:MAG: hypothetical protein VKN72_28020 [Nostocales cyanobacterium 94392]|nr:hypothetical protein [Nostocales cyanobacterium 94392]